MQGLHANIVGMLGDDYAGIALGVESAWPTAELRPAFGKRPESAEAPAGQELESGNDAEAQVAVTGAARKLLMVTSSIAFVAAAVRAIAALPQALYSAGVVGMQGWEEGIVESLKAFL